MSEHMGYNPEETVRLEIPKPNKGKREKGLKEVAEGSITHSEAVNKFEEALASSFGENGELDFVVNDETPEESGFALIQRFGINQKEPGLRDAKTIYLDTEKVKKVFDKLDPAVKKVFVDGLKDNLEDVKGVLKFFQTRLENEKDPAETEEIKLQITGQKSDIKKLEKQIQALA